jgi:hypothetical protein
VSTPRTNAPSYDADLAHARWRRSSYSGGANDCVEIAELKERVVVRDSKDVGLRPLVVSRAAMRELVGGLVQGMS